ncbi:unnamed protein product [Fraxinus pennsylvanica]|uniref:Inhibitor I9 domain-containing protein n=1 Tax=Fraxinus pennsylvanica TaxID=56036 RepID=A0AAD1ZG10_9LAMI|nr:unnamed protein product [Fraxinus pennsylvanica]
MGILSFVTAICILNLHSLAILANDYPKKSSLETYIVHVEAPDGQSFTQSVDLDIWYQSFLSTATSSSGEGPEIVYSYHFAFKGFAARLSPDDVKALEKKEGFISAHPEEKYSLHTTHSPNFLMILLNTIHHFV